MAFTALPAVPVIAPFGVSNLSNQETTDAP